MIIKWLASKLIPYLQLSEGMLNIFTRLDNLEKDSHPLIFEKEQLHKIHKRLEDLETVSFVNKFDKYKNYEGTD